MHGSDATDRIEEYLRAGFDYVVIGEVEETLRELATGGPQEQVAGLAYRDAKTGKTRRNLAVCCALDSTNSRWPPGTSSISASIANSGSRIMDIFR